MRAALHVAVLAVAASTVTCAARAEVHELKKDVPIDAAFTATAIGLVLGSEVAKPDLVPYECRWCAVNLVDERVRTALVWDDPKPAGHLSDVLAFVAAPATAAVTLGAAAAHDGAAQKTPVDVLLVLEATAASAMLNQVVKFVVARERPYGHYKTILSPHPTADARLSFYSGHTSLTFTLAAAAGTVAHLRGYRLAPMTWIPGAAIATATAYLRIAADKHYLTDVLAGAIAGAAMGILVPVLFHPRADTAADAQPAAGAAPTPSVQMFSFGGAF